jgi:hypothetical protein
MSAAQGQRVLRFEPDRVVSPEPRFTSNPFADSLAGVISNNADSWCQARS